MKRSERRLQLVYTMAQGTYWLLAVVIGAFLTPLLADRGFSEYEIGVISAVRSVATCVFQLVIAYLMDKYAKKVQVKYVIEVLACIGIIVSWYFYENTVSFSVAIIIFVLFGLGITSIAALLDSLSALFLNAGRQLDYPPARAFGSITWAIACLALGRFCVAYGENKMLLLQILFGFVFLCNMFFLEKVPKKQETTETEQRNPHNILQLFFLSSGYTLMILGVFAASMCYNMANCFMIDVIKNCGGTTMHYGIANFVLAISEGGTVFVFAKFRKKWGLKILLLLFAVFNAVKPLGMILFPSVIGIIALQVLQMLGYGIYYPANVAFVMEELPEEDVVKGVSVANVVNCIGAAAGFYVSGQIYAIWGITALLWSSAAMGGISVCIMGINVLWKRKSR